MLVISLVSGVSLPGCRRCHRGAPSTARVQPGIPAERSCPSESDVSRLDARSLRASSATGPETDPSVAQLLRELSYGGRDGRIAARALVAMGPQVIGPTVERLWEALRSRKGRAMRTYVAVYHALLRSIDPWESECWPGESVFDAVGGSRARAASIARRWTWKWNQIRGSAGN